MLPEEAHAHSEEAPSGALSRHLSKRARRNKNLVVVFDPAARREYVTGFHKRKKKRRKIAEKQKLKKEREKRLAERKERRRALKLAIGEAESQTLENEDNQETANSAGSEDDQHQMAQKDSVVYEDDEMLTIVNTCNIDMNGDSSFDHDQKKVNDAFSYRKAQMKKKRSSQKKSIGKSKRRK